MSSREHNNNEYNNDNGGSEDRAFSWCLYLSGMIAMGSSLLSLKLAEFAGAPVEPVIRDWVNILSFSGCGCYWGALLSLYKREQGINRAEQNPGEAMPGQAMPEQAMNVISQGTNVFSVILSSTLSLLVYGTNYAFNELKMILPCVALSILGSCVFSQISLNLLEQHLKEDN